MVMAISGLYLIRSLMCDFGFFMPPATAYLIWAFAFF